MQSTKTYTGDAATRSFAVGFPFLSEQDIRVTVGGTIKTRGVDYSVQDASARGGTDAVIQFAAAPANASAIAFYRNTPIGIPSKNPVIGHLAALVALYRVQERDETVRRLDYIVNATDLAAGTAQQIIAPCDGYIEANTSRVTETVGTGGDITVEVGGVAVVGLTNTIANSAAVGKVVQDAPTTLHSATTKAFKGQVITVTPAAAFATSGAIEGYLTFQPADF